MQLSELYLNRYLYRDNSQSSETQGADFISADSSESEPASIPSGGAAQDINTGGVEIDGSLIEPGTIPTVTLDVSNYGWGQTCAFSSTDLNTVSWGAGTFKSADGTTYNISTGNTGNMAAKTFIYLDLNLSTTAYQITTTSATAVGASKVLIAVAENAAVKATFMLSEATQIVGDNIVANTIDASKITTGTLIVGTNVALGTAFAAASAGDLATQDLVSAALCDSTIISGGLIITSLLSATNIQAGTLSSILIQTSTSANTGIKMSSAIGGMDVYGETIDLYYGSTLYGSFGTTNGYFGMTSDSNRNIKIKTDSGTTFFDVASGAGIAPLTSGQGNCGLSSQYWANVYTNNVNLSTGTINYQNGSVSVNDDFAPTDARSYNCGSASYMWNNVYTDAVQISKSGYTTKYITMNTSNNLEMNTGLYVGGTLSKAAGSFRIDHPLKPDTHYLQHSFVESPDMLNLYRGNGYILDGLCEVLMPDWFTPLNGTKTNDYSYQVTSIGKKNNIWVMKEMTDGKVIFAGESDGKFSYLITAIRHDKYAEENRIAIELEK